MQEYLKFEGVKIVNPDCTFISQECKFGKNVVVYPNNYLIGLCEIGDNVTLFPNNYIEESKIGNGCTIINSVIEKSLVFENVKIGPFSHLRPDSKICDNVKIGNFVEIKNSLIKQNSKVSHLSYVGDAEIGRNVNIGCGVVFVNYTGKSKLKSVVEDNSFIGSSVNIIAPVKIGKETYICAGTTVDGDVEDGDFVIGRSKMIRKELRAYKYFKGDN